MPPDFLTWKHKKANFFLEKLVQKKIQKTFTVNDNNKIMHAWYLSSKWPVCRSIVNQPTVGRSRTKLSTLLKTNIFKCFALFCKWLQYTQNKEILFIQIMGKCIRNFFPLNWRAKLVIYHFFYFVSRNSCVMLFIVLKVVIHI